MVVQRRRSGKRIRFTRLGDPQAMKEVASDPGFLNCPCRGKTESVIFELITDPANDVLKDMKFPRDHRASLRE